MPRQPVNRSDLPLGMTNAERQYIINAIADGGRDLPSLQVGELLAQTIEIARIRKGKRDGTRAVEALLKYEMHRQNLQVKAGESRALQQQIADLQNRISQQPEETQPLRILIEENNDRFGGGPQDSPLASPDAGSAMGEKRTPDVRSA